MGVELPAPMMSPLKALAWLWAPAFPETLSVDCLLKGSSVESAVPLAVQKVLFYSCMPIAALITLVVAERTLLQLTRSRRKAVMNTKERLWATALIVTFWHQL